MKRPELELSAQLLTNAAAELRQCSPVQIFRFLFGIGPLSLLIRAFMHTSAAIRLALAAPRGLIAHSRGVGPDFSGTRASESTSGNKGAQKQRYAESAKRLHGHFAQPYRDAIAILIACSKASQALPKKQKAQAG